jgi:uncharacterized RDD family membrane protein YckC
MLRRWSALRAEGGELMSDQASSRTLAPAEMTPRLIAFVIDAVVLGIVYSVVIIGIVIAALAQGGIGFVQSLLAAVLLAGAGFLYFAWGWTNWRASPGQRAMGLLTVNAADGATLTWNQAAIRYAYLFGPSAISSLFNPTGRLGDFLSTIVSIAVLLYYIYLYRTAASDPQRQGLHDKQAGTLVVKGTA